MHTHRLVGMALCPFLQRVAITLLEKDVPFEIAYIDPAQKPDWFFALSPLGRMPALSVDGRVLFESAALTEFVDEGKEPPLMPRDRFLRADHRAWIDATSETLRLLFGMVGADSETGFEKGKAALRTKLAQFEQRIAGPLFDGGSFSLVDATAAPLLQRATWLEELGPRPSLFEGMPKLTAWRDSLVARSSTRRSAPPDIHERFVTYVRGLAATSFFARAM
jgi:glutathione S-transferase